MKIKLAAIITAFILVVAFVVSGCSYPLLSNSESSSKKTSGFFKR